VVVIADRRRTAQPTGSRIATQTVERALTLQKKEGARGSRGPAECSQSDPKS
jgi:hypothetical protein